MIKLTYFKYHLPNKTKEKGSYFFPNYKTAKKVLINLNKSTTQYNYRLIVVEIMDYDDPSKYHPDTWKFYK